jgi:hypothetical protein
MLSLKLTSFNPDNTFIELITARHLSRKNGDYYLTFIDFDEYNKYKSYLKDVLRNLEAMPSTRKNERDVKMDICLQLLKNISFAEMAEIQ